MTCQSAVTAQEIATALESWYAAAGTAGLKLPDGWFGRPYDTMMPLTSIYASNQDVVVGLDGMHTLTIGEPDTVEATQEHCPIRTRGEIAWDWREDGSGRAHCETFNGGDIDFIAPALR